jgi:hypothetical protein
LRFSGGGTSELAVFLLHLQFSVMAIEFAVFQEPTTEFADCERVAFEFAVFRRRHLRIRGFHVEFAVFQWAAIEFAVSQYRILTKNK